jgi:uncharacterized protein (TIGR03118 family)
MGPVMQRRPLRAGLRLATALRPWMLAAAVPLLCACGGGYDDVSGPATPGSDSRYAATSLVSDQSGAAQRDARLLNPVALASGGGSMLWLANHGPANSTLFDTGHLSLPALAIAVPDQGASRSTGVAFNPANGFVVTTSEGRAGVARFIVASEDGRLSGWAPSLGLERAVVAFDAAATGAVYTGLAMTRKGVDSVLLAADFRHGTIDTFGPDFDRQPGAGRFVDPVLPAGYAPFGVAALGDLIYVAYAQPDASAHAPRRGAGSGLVNAFDATGRLVRRLVPVGGALNAPCSMALAPADFGTFGGALLVANAGDGTIAAFDPESGRPLGLLTRLGGAALVLDGLHGIAFGNGALGQPSRALFFTAGPQDGRHGLLGRIDLQ